MADENINNNANLYAEAITNAILEVTLEKRPQIYILSGKTYYDTSTILHTPPS